MSGGARRFRRGLAAFIALSAVGCVASRQDVRVLQQDLRLIRSEAARDDSLRSSQIARLAESLRGINDSLTALSSRLNRLRTDVQGRFSTLEDQVERAQELAGQSQTRVQELRAAIEQSATRRDTSAAVPGPNELYQLGRDQFMRGSNASARAAFQDLLTRYPDVDVAGDAQFYVAETYAAEGNNAAADSAYALVLSGYPRSSRAVTALYKRAVIAETARRMADARRLFNEVVTRFPRSDEAALARDRLRAIR